MKYLLDTNICVYFLRGKHDLHIRFEKAGLNNIHISEITIAELLFGAYKSNNPEKSISIVENFAQRLNVLSIRPILSTYAQQKVRLQKLGFPIHDDFDLLIGSTSLHYKLILVTENFKHLNRLEDIQIENWVMNPVQ